MAYKLKTEKKFRASWTDENGRRHCRSGFTKRCDATAFEDEERLKSRKIRAGHIMRQDLRHVEFAGIPFVEHLETYHRWKISEAGTETKHIQTTISVIRRVSESLSWKRVADIEPIKVRAELGKLLAATHNVHLSALAGFTKWLVQHGRLAVDPLMTLKRRNTDKDKTFERVPMTPEMVAKIIRSASGRGPKELYRFLSISGLRISEALSLNVDDFLWDKSPPCVRVLGKSQRIEIQPLPKAEIYLIRIWLVNRSYGGKVWEYNRSQVLNSFKADLERAGIPARRGLDLHSFRHGYITELSKRVGPGGITIEDLRILARHKSILTTAKYLHGSCDGNRGKAVDAAFS